MKNEEFNNSTDLLDIPPVPSPSIHPDNNETTQRYKLLFGETPVESDDQVYELRFGKWISGSLLVTNYRLIFQPNDASMYITSVPLTTMHACSKIGGKTSRGLHAYSIIIYTKDVRILKYAFSNQKDKRRKIFKYISRVMQPHEFFCFAHYNPQSEDAINGWKLYNPEKEFKRQGAFKTDQWRMTEANKHFAISKTYPDVFCVPKQMSDDDLKGEAKYRSRGRIPTLTFFYEKTSATMTRASQPLAGFSNKKNKFDTKMINSIIEANPNSKKLLVVDLRPRANAEANKMFKGAGYEKSDEKCTTHFLGIDNIHVMRNSFKKLVALCTSNNLDVQENFFSKLDSTDWLNHIRKILLASVFCVECLHDNKTSLLLHCSDGWDRTAQVSCIVQILLDPYFRTMEGFSVLIEKDWLSFGHQFNLRTNPGMRNFYQDQSCPVFFQFLECVYQLLVQHPTAFEFNEKFLICIADHLYSCRFGTFLFDNVKQRFENDVYTKTPSLWTYILSNKDKYLNPFYDPENTKDAIHPDTRHSSLRLWSSYWLRFSADPKLVPKPAETLYNKGMEMLKKIKELEDELSKYKE